MSRAAKHPDGPSRIAYVRLLGPVQVVARDGFTLDLPSITQRRLLAMMALDAGKPIRSELLAEELRMSAGGIRTTVSRLRRILGDGVLHTDAVGYRLEADVDSDLFCQALAKDGGGDDRLQRLESALAWWRGPAIEEFRHEAWARSESTRLTELHAAAVEDHAAELMARTPRQQRRVEQIERGYTDDQTVLIASAALLDRCHHPSADDVIATIASTAVAGHLALTIADLAGSVERGTPLTRESLRRCVLAGLADLAGQETPEQV